MSKEKLSKVVALLVVVVDVLPQVVMLKSAVAAVNSEDQVDEL